MHETIKDSYTDTYKVVRFYMNHERETIREGLTLAEARAHCKSNESSSKTCCTIWSKQHTELMGPWFDGIERE